MSKKNVQARAGLAAGQAEATAHDQATRDRAYELFVARRATGAPGDPISDWLQAEQEFAGAEKAATSGGSSAEGKPTPRSRRHSNDAG